MEEQQLSVQRNRTQAICFRSVSPQIASMSAKSRAGCFLSLCVPVLIEPDWAVNSPSPAFGLVALSECRYLENQILGQGLC